MKPHDAPDTDSRSIESNAAPGAATRAFVDGINIDLDHASRKLDPTVLEADALPFQSIKAA